jgi:hypothetical protein
LLEAQAESQTLEFKAACNWDISRMAKDILALSNVQDGGVIIIGGRRRNIQPSRSR